MNLGARQLLGASPLSGVLVVDGVEYGRIVTEHPSFWNLFGNEMVLMVPAMLFMWFCYRLMK
jgi:hypothetical protein